MRLAVGLCHQRKCALEQNVVADAMAVFQEFNDHLKEEGADFEFA